MPVQRPSLQKLITQIELSKFYDKPVAQVSAGLILSLLCVLFFALMAIRPTLQTMASLIKQIEEKKEFDRKLTLKIGALTSAQRELAIYGKRSSLVDAAIPPTARFTDLLFLLEKIAAERNVELTTISSPIAPLESTPSASLAALKLESLPFTATYVGSYENLLSMLQELQNVGRIVVIDKMDLSPSADDKREILNMAISARAFTFGPVPVIKK